MGQPKVYGRWNRPARQGELNLGEKIVETAGYIPPKIQIENMIAAGQRLADYRSGLYSNEPEKKEPAIDPTRSPGFDLADATQLGRAALERIEEAKTNVQLAKEKLAKENADQAEKDKQELELLRAEKAKKVASGEA